MRKIGTNFSKFFTRTLSLRSDHENISTAILPLLLIQEEQLSVDGERMFTKYWLTASGRLDQEQCGEVNWPPRHDFSCCTWTKTLKQTKR